MKNWVLIIALTLPLMACNATVRHDTKLLETAKVIDGPEAEGIKAQYYKDCLEQFRNHSNQNKALYCEGAEILKDVEGGYFARKTIEFKREDKTVTQTISKRIKKDAE